MGAGTSTLNKSSKKHVFEEELKGLNSVVNSIITADDKFVNNNYNFLFENVCKQYTLLWQAELDKHLKVELQSLKGAIYLVPKKDDIEFENGKLTKSDLCDMISKHYIKILYILSLVKTVYDLENHGDNSIAGIVQRNIKVFDDIMEINYCSIPHKDYDNVPDSRLNFGNLQGLDFFVSHFLTPTEKYTFIGQLKHVFARRQKYLVEKHVCDDQLVSVEEYNKIYKNKFANPFKCQKGGGEKKVDLMFEIVENNPILHSHYCMSQRKVVVPLKTKTPEVKHLEKLYTEMKNNYQTNVANIISVVNRIAERKGETYVLKNLSSEDLNSIIADTKKTLIVFYVQSIVDYQNILDHAKGLEHILLSK